MTKKDDGGPAFPEVGWVQDENLGGRYVECVSGGMTLRDWFAGRVLAGIFYVDVSGWPRSDREIAARAYRIADAMIAARSNHD